MSNIDDTPSAPDDQDAGFAELGLRSELLSSLNRLGYEEPTPIQAETIPLVLGGRDLVGQAATGTGKTAAFALPILNRMPQQRSDRPAPYALVLVPTRELAVQVSEAMYKYGRDLGARVLPVYGGQPIGRQLAALNGGVHVVVATPGRALDHIRRGSLNLESVDVVVLDEADEMLDMGFAEDIEAILVEVPAPHQTVLFSATMPPRIAGIAKRHLVDPITVQVGGRHSTVEGEVGGPRIRQTAYVVQRSHKAAALGRILDVETPTAAIVFCRTRDEVDQLTETMNGRGYRAEALHGGMSQEQRDRVMARLRNGTAELLMATDVAARGLDIDTLTHVVNYDVPSAPEAYVHRIGRVGRAGREGVAITLAEPREQRLLSNIERVTRQHIGISTVPTVADLRAKQLENTIATMRTALEADDLHRFDDVVTALSDEFELGRIVLAAVKLVHESAGNVEDTREIPDASRPPDRRPDRGRDGGDRSGDRRDRPGDRRGERAGRTDRPERGRESSGRDERWQRDPRDRDRDPRDRGPRDREPLDRDRRPDRSQSDSVPPGTARLYLGVGRQDGVRPQDLVGAIANETDLAGRQIGPIRISERFSVVGVPEREAERVIETMRRATIKGRKANVRRYVEH